MKLGGISLPGPAYRELKESYEARKVYLAKPDAINQLYQADFTQLHIPGFRVQYILLVMDHFSRYLLTLKLYPSMNADSFINGLENALEEAMKFSSIDLKQIITLVTGNNRAIKSSKAAKYMEMSPFYHIQGRTHHPHTRGMMESLIRTVKYEEIYQRDYLDPSDARQQMEKFRQYYNHKRLHQALKYKRPYMVYTGTEYRASSTLKTGA
jgi:putative transposase